MRMIMSPRLLNIPRKKNFVDVFLFCTYQLFIELAVIATECLQAAKPDVWDLIIMIVIIMIVIIMIVIIMIVSMIISTEIIIIPFLVMKF